MQQLDTNIVKLNFNVQAFVEFVGGQVQKLKSRGKTINKDHLNINIIKALKIVKDRLLRELFLRVEFEWLVRKRTLTIEGLSSRADTYYKVKNQNNTWGELSKEEEELIAMKSLMIKDTNLLMDDSRKKRKKKKASSKSSGSAQNDSEKGQKVPKWKLENQKNNVLRG